MTMDLEIRKSAVSNRFAMLDWLKAFGIVLVVVGHTPLPAGMTTWIYAFHIPLFFFCSGFLFPSNAAEIPPLVFWNKRLRKLVLYYLCFAAIGSVFYYLLDSTRQQFTLPAMVLNRLKMTVYASGTVDSGSATGITLFPNVLWFLPALIVSQALYYGILKACSSPVAQTLSAILLGGCAFLLKDTALPWEFESALLAVPWLHAGRFFRTRSQRLSILKNYQRVLPGILLLAAGSCLAVYSPCVDFRLSIFPDPLSWIICSLLLVSGFIALFFSFPANPFITYLSAATIIIFPLHTLVFRIIDSVTIRLLGTEVSILKLSYSYSIIKTVLALTFILLAVGSWKLVPSVSKSLTRRS